MNGGSISPFFRSSVSPSGFTQKKGKIQALLLAASVPGIGGRIYNVSDDKPITVGELFQLYGGSEQVPTKDGWLMSNLWELTVDTERIKQELNFHPKYPSIYTARDMGAL